MENKNKLKNFLRVENIKAIHTKFQKIYRMKIDDSKKEILFAIFIDDLLIDQMKRFEKQSLHFFRKQVENKFKELKNYYGK